MNTFGHKKPVYDAETGEQIGTRPAVVSRVTREPMGGQFGSDKNKRLVVSLIDGDVITVRPERTTRAESMTVTDIYRFMLRSRANLAVLERARKRKAQKAETRERRSIARADARIRKEARAQRET